MPLSEATILKAVFFKIDSVRFWRWLTVCNGLSRQCECSGYCWSMCPCENKTASSCVFFVTVAPLAQFQSVWLFNWRFKTFFSPICFLYSILQHNIVSNRIILVWKRRLQKTIFLNRNFRCLSWKDKRIVCRETIWSALSFSFNFGDCNFAIKFFQLKTFPEKPAFEMRLLKSNNLCPFLQFFSQRFAPSFKFLQNFLCR